MDDSSDYPLGDHARIRVRGKPCACDLGKGITLPFGFVASSWYLARYAECWHNEMSAIRRRHMMPVPPSKCWSTSLAVALGHSLGTFDIWSEHDVVGRIAGAARKRRYEGGFDRLRSGAAPASFAMIRSFVKVENTNLINGVKDPRLIQFRAYPFTAELARYLGPVEERLCHWKPRGRRVRDWFPICERMVAKGLNPNGRADLIDRVKTHFARPVQIGLDGHRWDAHVSKEALEWEHAVYRTCFPGDRNLASMLRKQLVNKGTTIGGIKYTVTGTRMSGDRNTGLGNCLVNLGLNAQAMRLMGIRKWHIIVDGDDCILFLEESDVGKLDVSVYTQFGFVVKIEEQAGISREDVEFCQSRLVRLADGPRLVRNPAKVLSCMGVAGRPLNPREWVRRMHTVAECEMILNNGVPVLGPFAMALLDRAKHLAGGRRMCREWSHEMLESGAYQWLKGSGRPLSRKPIPINEEARASFYTAFGLDEAGQVSLEAELVQAARLWVPPLATAPVVAGLPVPGGRFLRTCEPGGVPL